MLHDVTKDACDRDLFREAARLRSATKEGSSRFREGVGYAQEGLSQADLKIPCVSTAFAVKMDKHAQYRGPQCMKMVC